MHLLDTSTLRLHEFTEGQVPKYAILSHTWGDEEVLFRDIDKYPTSKAGWSKIQSACRVARERGHSWIWIDTCCIDKASSSELSEAINSMFRWYKEAEICFAYLSDVVHSEPGTEECETTLAGSRWFTRGWTLQELLAPPSLDFYAQDWRPLGPRRLFGGVIEQRTGIRRRYLSAGRNVNSASVAERMSWASQRKTTRTEDVAYCLLGIFDVNMPLIYGEGTKAFQRLQEAIIRDHDDQSIFAWGRIVKGNAGIIREMGGLDWPLLARSPAYFKDSGDVIPIYNIPSTRVRIENSGIVIGTPLLAETPSRWIGGRVRIAFLAPLLCRRRNDIFNTIALPVQSITATPDFDHLESLSYYRASDRLSTFSMNVWTSERLCSAFIKFKRLEVLNVAFLYDSDPTGCAVRTLPKGFSLGAPYLFDGQENKSAGFPITDCLDGSYGLASPIVIPLWGPPVPGSDGEEQLALVLQYQYMSTAVGDDGSVAFENRPSWMVNRVVTIPPGSTIAVVAHGLRAESHAWPAEYVRRVCGTSNMPDSGAPNMFNRSSFKTFSRFHVGVSNETVHGPLHIVDVVDLIGVNVSPEVDHNVSYTPVKGEGFSRYGRDHV